MGSWDDGILNNDGAMDTRSDLVEGVHLGLSPAHFATGIGLRLWLVPGKLESDPLEYEDYLEEHSDWIAKYPISIRDVLERVLGDSMAAASRTSTYTEHVAAVLGKKTAGPMERDLLDWDEAEPVVAGLANLCRGYLDDKLLAFDRRFEPLEKLDRPLGALGLLVELTTLGVRSKKAEIDRWERAFEEANCLTKSQRDFWDGYARRVHSAFSLLRQT